MLILSEHAKIIQADIVALLLTCIFWYVLLTVHLSIFILVTNQLDAQNFVLQ